MLEGYIGQEDRLQALRATLRAHKAGRALPHMLLLGGSGRGKTRLAQEIALATNKKIVVLHCPSVMERNDVSEKIIEAEGNILFLDEIHALPRQIAEDLYTTLDNNQVAIDRQVISYQKRKTIFALAPSQLSPDVRESWHGPDSYRIGIRPKIDAIKETYTLSGITIIGATTDEALLPEAFLSRLSALKVYLRPYTEVELGTIATLYADQIGYRLDPDAALYVALRSRSTPRRAIQLVERSIDFAVPRKTVLATHTKRALTALGVDEYGLEEPHRQILSVLANGAMSRTTLGQRLGLSPSNLTLYWGDLLEQGMVQVTTRHEITAKGLEAISK